MSLLVDKLGKPKIETINAEGRFKNAPFMASHYFCKYSKPQKAVGLDFICAKTGETFTVVMDWKKARELAHSLTSTAAFASEPITLADGTKA